MEKKSKPINIQINNIIDEQVRLNRKRLEPIVGGILYVFIEAFLPIVYCLEDMKLNRNGSWNSDMIHDASGQFFSRTAFQFIVCLIVIYFLFHLFKLNF